MPVSRDESAAAATARFFSDMGWAPQLQQASLQDVNDSQDRSGLTSDTGHSRASTASSPGPATWEHRRTSSEHVNAQGSMQNSFQNHGSMGSAGPSSASSSAFAGSSRFYPNDQMVGLATGAGLDLLGVQEMEDEEEADDNDDETDSKVEDTDTQRQSASADNEGPSVNNGLRSQSEAVKRKAGGRPRDFIWRYYEDHFIDGKRAATCKFCSNRQEMPKAFRMRQHIANCKNAPADAKVMVRQEQERKDEDARLKKLAQSRKKTHASKVGATSSFHALLHPDEAPAAPHQNLSFNHYGLLSGALPVNPLAGGLAKGEPQESEDDSPEASTSKRKAPASSARKRKKAKKEDTLTHFLSDPVMAPQQPAPRSPVTCHVLDSTAGKPGSNVRIRLDQLGQTGFVHVANGETDSDGRNGSLLTPGTAIAKNSIFKLTFYTKDYWTAKGVESFYPFVEVVFEIKEPSEHHHIALMLSPFAYTTYRGS